MYEKDNFIDYSTVESPAFIFHKKILDENIKNIVNGCSIVENNVTIAYSLKTNPNPFLIKYLVQNGLYIEVVSFDEYNYVIDLGVEPQKIIYNGPRKDKQTLIMAIENNGLVNIDSFEEIEWLLDSDIKNKKIGIRVNFPIDEEIFECFDYSLEGSRFGFDIKEDKSIVRYIKRLYDEKKIVINGIHFHCNTKNRTSLIYKKMIQYCNFIINNYDLSLEYLDLGGGFLGGTDNCFSHYTKIIKKEISRFPELQKINLIIEPGAAIVATAVSYFTRVIDRKIINNRLFITLDGSRIHIDPTFSNKKYNYISNCVVKSNIPVTVCGFTCMEKDRIKISELALNPNDYIIFNKLGAYTLSLVPNFICGYPNIYWYDKELKLIVKKKQLRRCLE